ncbi:hypothetical protein HDU83_009964 [Entophlyctis luteolus]|nr:hypothetical protein HDU82_006235 [Entophlyctis luteolus]KAJ3350023.1 hypothetical protein HDU83_009964 [Entophlyctis luteolus]KAJ3386668.1 hypothetical protein HDU84_001358 [Entophlyctis sp. JEL0112]
MNKYSATASVALFVHALSSSALPIIIGGSLCLDVPNSVIDAGTQVQAFECTGGTNQDWTLTANGIQSSLGNVCLDRYGGSTADGTPVVLWPCDSTDPAQKWDLSYYTDDVLQYPVGAITDPVDRQCLDVTGGLASNGLVEMYTCNGGTGQQFLIAPPLKVGGSLCLDVPYGNSYNGAPVQAFECNGQANQAWYRNGPLFVSALGNYCLDRYGGGSADGTSVVLWQCDASDSAQLWVTPFDIPHDGEIQSPDGQCLDVTGGVVSGATLEMFQCSGNSNQLFAFGETI